MVDCQKELFLLDKIVIQATARSEKPKKVRRDGWIPGVLNGPGTASTSVQFEGAVLNRIIEAHGTAMKLWVEINGEKKYGFLREVQRHPVDEKILHVAIQLVSADQNIRFKLPIDFLGEAALRPKVLYLQVDRSEIEVEGKTSAIPDHAAVDVSQKEYGDSVTAADFNFPDDIRILDPKETVYATVKGNKQETPVKAAEEQDQALAQATE